VLQKNLGLPYNPKKSKTQSFIQIKSRKNDNLILSAFLYRNESKFFQSNIENEGIKKYFFKIINILALYP